jgi:hypothetical protein
MNDLPANEIAWLQVFFSGRNALSWENIIHHTARADWLEQVSPWLGLLSHVSRKYPMVLPVFDENGPCQWYGVAEDDVAANALSQELMAFIGPSYSDFYGLPVKDNSTDPLEQALQDRFGRFVFLMAPTSITVRQNITQTLKLYLDLLRRRPDIPDRTQRPFGRIRYEFDQALLVGNEADARQLRDELVATGRIDATQNKYLEIRLLAGLGHYHQLARDSSLIRSVTDLSLPGQIITDLIESLYIHYIVAVEEDENIDIILTQFRNHVLRQYGTLFRERKGIRQPNVLKAFLLYELAQDTPNVKRCETIAETFPSESGRHLITRWLNGLNRPINAVVQQAAVVQQDIDSAALAKQAWGDEDYTLALDLCFAAHPATWTYNILLRCAVEIDDRDIMQRVLDTVSQAPEDIQAGLKQQDHKRLEKLRQILQTPDKPIIRYDADWIAWACYVEQGNHEKPPLKILEDALPGWSFETYANDPQSCENLAEKIGNATEQAEKIFRGAFPALVDFFVERPDRLVPSFMPLYRMLLFSVACNGLVSSNELELASTIMHTLLNSGPSQEDYQGAVDEYKEILIANSAPNHINWALNSAELLALYPCPPDNRCREKRLHYFMEVVNILRSHGHRLTPAQYPILCLLAQDYGCPDLLDNFPNRMEENANNIEIFKGVIGIYTLMESAGQRAKQFLTERYPEARVEINSDPVATDRLTHLARTADIFVFAWKSSKHQAYYAAKEARGNQQTLLPSGKGTASILDCVLNAMAHSPI